LWGPSRGLSHGPGLSLAWDGGANAGSQTTREEGGTVPISKKEVLASADPWTSDSVVSP